jgi:hypothetical protein
MIKQLYNVLKEATMPYTTFSFGVEVTKNLNGDELYPLTHVELPLLSNLDSTYTDTSNFTVVMYVVEQRIDKTQSEELEQLDRTYLLALDILKQLSKYQLDNVTILTYVGNVENNFTDDCNGVRVQFNIILNKKC